MSVGRATALADTERLRDPVDELSLAFPDVTFCCMIVEFAPVVPHRSTTFMVIIHSSHCDSQVKAAQITSTAGPYQPSHRGIHRSVSALGESSLHSVHCTVLLCAMPPVTGHQIEELACNIVQAAEADWITLIERAMTI
jgi:hypothetical protein